MDITVIAFVVAVIVGLFGLWRLVIQVRERRERRGAESFRHVRQLLKANRAGFQQAAASLLAKRRPSAQSETNAHLFALPGWLCEVPVPLSNVDLSFADTHDKLPSSPHGCLPRTPMGQYDRYSRAIETLDRPAKFDDYAHYRLLEIQPFALRFSTTRSSYFQKIDFGDYLAYEWVHRRMPPRLRRKGAPTLWRTMSQPRDYVVLSGVCTLTLIHDGGNLRFLMHHRSTTDTAFAMGTFHVIPAGEFQPSCQAPVSFTEDLDLWRNMMREYAEEVLNLDEYNGVSTVPFNYDVEPYKSLERERRSGAIRLFYLGTGLDPLTLQAEILTVAVFKHSAFLSIFPTVRTSNREGLIVTDSDNWGRPFTAGECEGYMAANTVSSAQLLLKLGLRNKSLFERCFAVDEAPLSTGNAE